MSQNSVGSKYAQNDNDSSANHIDDNRMSQLQPDFLRSKYGKPSSQVPLNSGHASQTSELGMSTPNHVRASQFSVIDHGNSGTQVSVVQGSGQHSSSLNLDRRSGCFVFRGCIE